MKPILRSCWAIVLATAGLPAFAADEVKYDLRGPGLKVGIVLRTFAKYELNDADHTTDTQGKIEKGKSTSTIVREHEIKVLAVDGRFVTKFQTKIVKHEDKTTITLMKTTITRQGGFTTETKTETKTKESVGVSDLLGTTVLSVKKGKEWEHSLVGAIPTEEQKSELAEMPRWYDDDDLPDGKVPVGHSWEVSAAHMMKMNGPQVETATGKAKATFLRVEKHRGELCAVIEQTGRFKSKLKEVDGESASLDTEYKMTSYRAFRLGCVLTTNATGTTHHVSKMINEKGVEVRTETKGNFSASTTVTEAPGK